MLVKTKKVYYCEYCSRHRLTSHSIKEHEKHCTLNPNRTCRMCDGLDLAPLLKKYGNRFKIDEHEDRFGISLRWVWTHGEVTIGEIDADTDGCPACTLAVLRITGLNTPPSPIEFNYQKAKREWWDTKNDEWARLHPEEYQ